MQALIDAAQQWRRELRDGMVDGDRFYPELCLSLDGAPYIRVPPLIMCDSSCERRWRAASNCLLA